MVRTRWYITGPVCVECDGAAVREDDLPGRKVVLVLAMLAAEHDRAVSRGQLAELMWPGGPPPRWEADLRAIISRLRSGLRLLDGVADHIVAANGGYQLRLGRGDWVDLDEAISATHLAEAALVAGDVERAATTGWVAATITRRGFLGENDAPWIEEQRHRLRALRLRALDTLSEALSGLGDHDEAIRHAELAVATDPFRERSHRRLIGAHAAAGDHAAAARSYRACESLLATELGVAPSPATTDTYRRAVG